MLQRLCLNFKTRSNLFIVFQCSKTFMAWFQMTFTLPIFFYHFWRMWPCLAEMGEADSLFGGFHRHMLLLEVNDAWVEVFKGPSKEGPSCFAWRTKLKKAVVDKDFVLSQCHIYNQKGMDYFRWFWNRLANLGLYIYSTHPHVCNRWCSSNPWPQSGMWY